MVRAAVIGASGYAGGELVRFLDAHPDMDVAMLTAHTRAGESLGTVHPHLDGRDRVLTSFAVEEASDCDVVFLALPHGASSEPAMALADSGAKIVDLGSDFRLDTPARYAAAYGSDHPYPEALGTWAYGIPELFSEEIASARRVAAPGCYPTSVLIGIGPLVLDGLIAAEGIIADAMSGVSGAGRSVAAGLQFGAVDESVKAYKVLTHRHQPEMERALDALGGTEHHVLFTPHLVPMQRGILATVHAAAQPGVGLADLEASLDAHYDGVQFVRRLTDPPETRWVVGSNNALVSVHQDDRTGQVIVLSAIDNLVKGAAGQAIQCANLMFGFDEAAGLPTTGWMP